MAEDDDVFDLRQLLPNPADLRQLVLRDEEHLDLRMPQPEQQVVRLFEFHGERYADRPRIEETQLGDDPSVAAFGQNRDLVAAPDTHCGKSGSHLKCLLFGLCIRCRLEFVMPFFEQKSLLAVFRDGGFEEIDEGFLHMAGSFGAAGASLPPD